MKTAKIRNNADYDRTFFGIDVTIKPEEQIIDRGVYGTLIKNCVNFQQMTNPPEHGGEPIIRVFGDTPEGDVRIDGGGLGNPTMFTAPQVKLKAGDITEIPKRLYDKLQSNNRFQSLKEAGDVEVVGVGDK